MNIVKNGTQVKKTKIEMWDALLSGFSCGMFYRTNEPTFSVQTLHIFNPCLGVGSHFKETPPNPTRYITFYVYQTAASHLPIKISYAPPIHRLTEVLSMQLCNHLNIDEQNTTLT